MIVKILLSPSSTISLHILITYYLQVRWADLEAAKENQMKKEIGFTIGSEWNQVSEEEVERILNEAQDNDNSDVEKL